VNRALQKVEKLLGIPNPHLKWQSEPFSDLWKARYKDFNLEVFAHIISNNIGYSWKVKKGDAVSGGGAKTLREAKMFARKMLIRKL